MKRSSATDASQRSRSAQKSKQIHESSETSPCCSVIHEADFESRLSRLSLSSGLADMLGTVDADTFLENHFRHQAVHVTCSSEQDRVQYANYRVAMLREEMFDLDASSIFRETSSDNVFFWLPKKNEDNGKNASFCNREIHSVEISEVETAFALHKYGGHASYCRAPPHVEQRLVANMLRDTGLGCGQYDPSGESLISMGRGEVETFLSTHNHLTNWHYDFQENFTVQLSGTKRWTLQRGALRDPIRGCTPHYAAPEAVESQLKAAQLYDRKFRFGYPERGVNAEGDSVTIDVRPGDVLYFPAGMWHKVEALEPGVSINISLMASNCAQVFCQALQHMLMKDPKWRAPVINNGTVDVVANFHELMKGLPGKLDQWAREGGGAQAFLPPIVRFPPSFHVDEGNQREGEDSEMSGSEEASFDAIESEDGREDNEVLDVAEFSAYPEVWSLPTDPPPSLVRNPLAHLVLAREITDFYCGQESVLGSKFVLNVNYAGNETHQSVVRVEFQTTRLGTDVTGQLAGFEAIQTKSWPFSSFPISLTKFLVYHGYLVQSRSEFKE